MKKKTNRVPKRRPVKPLANPSFNIHHEELAPKIEEAFKSGGVQYYRFIEDHQIPAGRYKYIYAALREADMRMSLDQLNGFLDALEDILNGGAKKNNINVGEVWKIVINMRSRAKLAFEPASVRRLASVIYFDETEDLKTYDKKHGMFKVERWEKHGTMDFFLTRPIVELFGLRNFSLTYLEEYIQWSEEVIKDLTADLRTPSLASSSGNGSLT